MMVGVCKKNTRTKSDSLSFLCCLSLLHECTTCRHLSASRSFDTTEMVTIASCIILAPQFARLMMFVKKKNIQKTFYFSIACKKLLQKLLFYKFIYTYIYIYISFSTNRYYDHTHHLNFILQIKIIVQSLLIRYEKYDIDVAPIDITVVLSPI